MESKFSYCINLYWQELKAKQLRRGNKLKVIPGQCSENSLN
jgi:hypothetical protein